MRKLAKNVLYVIFLDTFFLKTVHDEFDEHVWRKTLILSFYYLSDFSFVIAKH